MDFRYIIFVLLTLLISKICVLNAHYTNKTDILKSKEDILNKFFVEFENDREFRDIQYYIKDKLVQKPQLKQTDYFIRFYETTAEHCIYYLTKKGIIDRKYSIEEFTNNIADFDFTHKKDCKNYQDIWTKHRTDEDIYVTMDLGYISNLKLYATTLADVKVYNILERFMMEIYMFSLDGFWLEGLDECTYATDRPATVLFNVLASIRYKYPKGLSTPTKRSLDEITRVINKYMPLYKYNREINNIMHSINVLFLLKGDNVESVRSIEDLGVAMVFIDDEIVSNELLIRKVVSEHINPLFQVCQNLNLVKPKCNRF